MNIMNKFQKIIISSSVAIFTFIVFLPSLRNDFVNWDDDRYVCENPFIRSLDTQLFKSALGGFYAGNWHPLTWISHALDYALWRLNPLGHHLTNNVIHALNVSLVVFLVMMLMEAYEKTRGDRRLSHSSVNNRTLKIASATTGLLFGIHPLHVESVAWLAERKDLLCAFFFFITVIVYIRYVEEITARDLVDSTSRFFNKKYLFAIASSLLSFLSKPMAVSLPFALLILDWCVFGRMKSLRASRSALVEKVPFFLLTIISSILTISAQQDSGAIATVEALPLGSRVIVAARSLILYLVKIIAPLNLVPFYPYPKNISLFSLEDIIPVVGVITITIICVAVMRKQKLWISVWNYYLVTLIPVLGIIQVGSQSMADRYTYLPSLGPLLLIGLMAAMVYERISALTQWRIISKMIFCTFFIAMLLFMSCATSEQIGIWRNSTILWKYVVDKEPGRVPVAHNNLGNAYASEGLFDMAIEQYRIALKLDPDYVDAHNNLGSAYQSTGRFDMAIEQYLTALRLKPDCAEAHFNLGLIYMDNGSKDMAREEFEMGLRIKPDDFRAHQILSSIAQGRH